MTRNCCRICQTGDFLLLLIGTLPGVKMELSPAWFISTSKCRYSLVTQFKTRLKDGQNNDRSWRSGSFGWKITNFQPSWVIDRKRKRPAITREAFSVVGSSLWLELRRAAPTLHFHDPTLASSSPFSTFTILNCSACIPVSARNDSLPKYRFSISMRCFSSSVRSRSSTVGCTTMRS